MSMRFTNEALKSLQIPQGRRKLSVSDADQRGLVFDLHPSGGYFQFRYSVDGRQRSISLGRLGPLTVKDARTKAAQLAREVALGHDPQEAKRERRETPVYGDFIRDQYLPHAKAYKRSHATDECTLRLHILPVFGSRRMSAIRKADMTEFIQKKLGEGYAPGTVNRFLNLMRYTFNLAVDWGVTGIQINPLKGIRQLQENNKIERYLTDEEAVRLRQSLMESESVMLPVIVAMLLVTGARKREVLDARWDQIDLRNRIWRIPLSKSGKARHVPITGSVVRVLALAKEALSEQWTPQRAAASEWIFPNPDTGKPYVSIFYAWNSARTKAGIKDVRIHDLRHTFASTLVNQGVPIYEVQKILGHQNIRTTERYAHLAPKRLEASAAVAGERFSGLLGLGTHESEDVAESLSHEVNAAELLALEGVES